MTAQHRAPDPEQIQEALMQLEGLVAQCQGLLARAQWIPGLPRPDAVDQLLHRLGDEAPVDDFEAGRRRDRRLRPRHGPGQGSPAR